MAVRILLISHNFSPFIGGIEVISHLLAQAFTSEGYEVHVLTWSKDHDGKTFSFKVIRNPNIYTLFREHKWADLVFENNPSLRLSWPGLFFNKPSIVSLQTWVSRADGRRSLIDKIKLKWLKRANTVISCSKSIQKHCWPESLVIQNPYQEKIFQTIPGIVKDKDFVFLGRMVSDKGADLAIKAFHRVRTRKKTSSDISLTLVGDGPERKSLEELVKILELNDQVEFTGTLRGESLVNCLNRHRFMLVPSVWEEPFGIVVLEGMACGCIPIVSDGGGLPEALGNGGLIFKRGNLENLIICMLEILKNPELDQQYRNNTESHLAYHQSSIVAKRYLEVIESAFKNRQLAHIREVSL